MLILKFERLFIDLGSIVFLTPFWTTMFPILSSSSKVVMLSFHLTEITWLACDKSFMNESSLNFWTRLWGNPYFMEEVDTELIRLTSISLLTWIDFIVIYSLASSTLVSYKLVKLSLGFDPLQSSESSSFSMSNLC